MKKVLVRQEKVTIPTYPISAYDKNPMFLEKRVYQGSSGRVYPHPVCEGVSDTKVAGNMMPSIWKTTTCL